MFENPGVLLNVSHIRVFGPRIDTFILTQTSALVTDRPRVSGNSSIDEELPPKQLSEIVTTSQLKDHPSTSGTSYIQVAEINPLPCYSGSSGSSRKKRPKKQRR
ncbi:hypothetical protein ILUMI_10851 [Ignelater luminosus]|uniref:Uncharacterized protein n=1 Tax=Ignelater luminosus TaxID=2038154 RepID=A0A8K0D2I2_IGNLU|nr:hypothetical protein ILUMI_10851 [Ignelater luminosus]